MADVINFDCADVSELHAYLSDETNHPLLRDYAACKARAIECRLAGRIGDALKWESACDHDYAQLPVELKW